MGGSLAAKSIVRSGSNARDPTESGFSTACRDRRPSFAEVEDFLGMLRLFPFDGFEELLEVEITVGKQVLASLAHFVNQWI